jgi:diacylglycerol kinase family enzyme
VAAAVALLALGAALVLACALALRDFPRGVPVVLAVGVAAAGAIVGLLHRGAKRALALAAAAAALVAAVVLIATGGRVLETAILIGCLALAVAAARVAFLVHHALPRAEAPRHPVLFWNPRSGGGKATRFRLPEEARARGVEPVELGPGDDLYALVDDAVARGCDGLAMAGGDGSQAIVAGLAARHGLPYACVPAGTRNHFALDLGVDREDVVGALDAFVDGGERRVDLAEVNGRVFVNNVSLGVYADAVQRPEYRDSKIRTLIAALPEAHDAGPGGLGLRWPGPDGRLAESASVILVSNNLYRLGPGIASGTRPRLDAGLLGVAVLDEPGGHPRAHPWQEWTVPTFEVDSDRAVSAGIDGESAVLDPPLRFASRPRALRVRVSRSHPGASPSAAIPDSPWAVTRALGRIALGRTPADMRTRS